MSAPLSWIKQHRWKSAIIALIAVFILALPIILKGTVQQAIYSYSHPYGIEKVSLKNIDFNIFKGTLLVNKLRLYTEKTEYARPITEIKQLEIDVSLTKLFKQQLYIKSLTFAGAYLPFTLAEDKKQVFLAGIPLLKETDNESAPENKQENSEAAIDIGIEKLHFNDIKLSLLYQQQRTELQINDLSLTDLYSWQDGFGRLILAAQLNGQELRSNLQLHLFRPQPKIIGTFKLDALNSDEFAALLPELDFEFHAKLKNDITFTAEFLDSGVSLFQQGNILVQDIAFKQDNMAANIQQLEWKGDLRLKPTAQVDIELDGDLSIEQPQMQQEALQIKLQQLTTKGKTKLLLTDNTQIKLQQAVQAKGFSFANPTEKQGAQGDISLNTNASIVVAADKTQIEHQGALQLKQFNYQQPNLNNQIPSLSSQGSATVILAKATNIKLDQVIKAVGLQLDEQQAKLALTTNLTATTKAQIDIDEQGLQVAHTGDLAIQDTLAKQDKLQAQIKQANWQGKLDLASQENLQIASSGSFKLDNLAVSSQAQSIANLNNLSIKNIDLSSLDKASLKTIQLNGLAVGNPSAQQQLTSIKRIDLTSLGYVGGANKPPQIKLGKLNIDNSETHITLDKDNKITQLEPLLAAFASAESTAKEAAPAEEQKTAATDTPPSLLLSLQNLQVTGKNPIQLSFENIQPPVQKTLHIEKLSLGKVDNSSPNQVTDYQLKLRFDEFSQLSSEGKVTPLNPTHTLDASTQLDDFALVDISHLSEGSIGYQIKSGQLTAKLETEIKDNKINAKNKVSIHKLEVASGEGEEAEKRRANFPVPLETGLKMLQDKNDNIKLDVPINGDLDNPDFNINNIINTALGKAMAGATRTYLLLALQPFGALALAGEMVIDKAGALSLEAIRFTVGSDQLNPSMHNYLAKLGKLLKEKKGLQIKLCDGVLESEREVMRQQAIQKQIALSKEQDKPELASEKALKAIQINDQQMLELAAERQKQIKRELIAIGVQGSQVVLCKPSIIKKDKKAQVNVKI